MKAFPRRRGALRRLLLLVSLLPLPACGDFSANTNQTPGVGARSGSGGTTGDASPSGGLGGSSASIGAGSTGSSGGTGGTGVAQGPLPVELGTAGDFVILAKSGITNVPTSILIGDVGVSPIDSNAITGFTLMADDSGAFATSGQIAGKVYAVDYTSPTPSKLAEAVSAMETAFIDAAARINPDSVELGSGNISGLTLAPGLYKWSSGVSISTDVTLEGGPDDVWIFQISGGVIQESGASVLLADGARPENVFWQVSELVALAAGAHLEGIVLSKTAITLAAGATVNGRLLSQTAVTLDFSTVSEPAR